MASSFKLYGSWVDVASNGKGMLRFAGIEAHPVDGGDGQFSAVLSVPVKQADGAVAYQSSLVTVEPCTFESAPASLSVYDDGFGTLEIDGVHGVTIRVFKAEVSEDEVRPSLVTWSSSSSAELSTSRWTGVEASTVRAMAAALALAGQLAFEFDKAAGR